ncbi:MAG: TIGR02186 family protein [Pseudomonadota bacterium]|nr:TIGR02186 family protein [Pseudomonadota bacterium]
MLRLILILTVLLALPARAQQEQIVAGLSQNRVAIDTTFVGSEILVFGAVKRDRPAPDSELGVVIVIEGPTETVTVRRKERRFGIWINTEEVHASNVPSFYAVATSAAFDDVVNEEANTRRLVSIDEAIWILDRPDIADTQAFADAVIRIREEADLYTLKEDTIKLDEATLFSTAVQLPSNLVEGLYTARIYLTRGGFIVSDHISYVSVQKVGLERWLYNLAHDQPVWYGLLSLAIAIAAGYGASTAFRMLSRS